MRKIVPSFLIIVGCTAAIPVRNEDWIQLGKAGPNHELVLTFAIKRTNPGWLDEKLRAVSYPDSPEYGKYMNFDEIAEYVHGRPESVEAVVDVLALLGVEMESIDFTIGLDFAVVTIPVAAAETLFAAGFYEFQHSKKTGWTIVRCLSYTVPKSLTEHLEFVFGLTEFPVTNLEIVGQCLPPEAHEPPKAASEDPAGLPPTPNVNPSLINRSYNLSDYTSTSSKNSQAVSGFGNLVSNYSPDDLKTFQKKYNIPLNPINKIVGNNNASDPELEADLDVEYITAVGRRVLTWYIVRHDFDFLQWIVDVVNTTDAPWVHSVSYYGSNNPIHYEVRCEDEFKKFGISGRTLLFPSGDLGVDCINQSYVPIWPGSSPHVTSVGGTLYTDQAWVCGGGGFSDVFPIPDYQKPVVAAYLKSGEAPPMKYFNNSGRAYPDVSAFAVNVEGIVNGKLDLYYGTRFSTPTVAGVVSCLNDIRLNKGKPTLGFLNPLLYQTLEGKGFHDISEGENSGVSSCPGFKAIKGWDPATGWGSPNFGILKTLVLQV